ncbi:MAG: hypothetical protein JKX68_03675 [Flavobacteriales bacterium]|nr:hypothetical protein [Flavobacteriales bacterium]
MKSIIATIVSLAFISIVNGQSQGNQTRLNIEVDLIQPILGGFGGSLGVENNHFGFGLMAFRTPLSNSSRDIVMNGADNYQVLNWGVEIYVDYFFKARHTGFYVGGLLSLDGYEMSNEIHSKETILGLYVVPKVGYRWVMSKQMDWLYLQPSLALPVLVWDDAPDFQNSDISLSRVIVLPMLTLGVRLGL